MPQYEIKLEFLGEVKILVSGPIPVGPSSWGTRFIFPLEKGVVEGPRLSGQIRPFGADWGLIRADDCFELDVRAVIETKDGAYIHTYYGGIIDMTKEQADMFRKGDLPKGLIIYVTPRFETSHRDYLWLNRIQVVGRGTVVPEGDKFTVTYSWYVLTAP